MLTLTNLIKDSSLPLQRPLPENRNSYNDLFSLAVKENIEWSQSNDPKWLESAGNRFQEANQCTKNDTQCANCNRNLAVIEKLMEIISSSDLSSREKEAQQLKLNSLLSTRVDDAKVEEEKNEQFSNIRPLFLLQRPIPIECLNACFSDSESESSGSECEEASIIDPERFKGFGLSESEVEKNMDYFKKIWDEDDQKA